MSFSFSINLRYSICKTLQILRPPSHVNDLTTPVVACLLYSRNKTLSSRQGKLARLIMNGCILSVSC